MSMQLEQRIKKDIITWMNLKIDADEISGDTPLFGEGLGLDSVDALELVAGLEDEYGVKVEDDDVEGLANVSSIAIYLIQHPDFKLHDLV